MTGEALITYYQDELVDNSTESDTSILSRLNIAYRRILTIRDWHFLKTEDASQSIVASQKEYDLPSDLLIPIRIVLQDPTKLTQIHYMYPVNYEDRFQYQNSDNHFYIDYKNSKVVLLSDEVNNYIGDTLRFEYTYKPSDITTSTSPVFLETFHPLLAYEAARTYWYKEQDQKARSWNNEMNNEYILMLEQMYSWDDAHQNFSEPSLDAVSPYDQPDFNY